MKKVTKNSKKIEFLKRDAVKEEDFYRISIQRDLPIEERLESGTHQVTQQASQSRRESNFLLFLLTVLRMFASSSADFKSQ